MAGSTHGHDMTTRPQRITSLDIVRGVVMVLMAIDHVRVYSGVPAGGPTPGIFFTRWITHFCAPAFVFFAGTAAYLHGQSLGDVKALSRYLATRGLLLVVLELTVIRAGWTFGLDYSTFILAGVIWMLGWCMVMMAGLVRLRTKTIGIFGLLVILFQQIFYGVAGVVPDSAWPVKWLLQILYTGGQIKLGSAGPTVTILYVLIPWIGVMAAGYAFGTIMTREPEERRRLCLRIGLSATALFVVVGGLFAVLAPAPEDAPPALFRMLNQSKYPPSQLFLLMTLGPSIALLPVAERARGWVADVLATFGRVPLFYYLLHIPLIHASALVVALIREGAITPEWYATAPFTSVPEEHRWGLPLLYLVFAIDVAILYFACRWYARVKRERPDTWLRYV
jgi:uncharacterized membrane protein